MFGLQSNMLKEVLGTYRHAGVDERKLQISSMGDSEAAPTQPGFPQWALRVAQIKKIQKEAPDQNWIKEPKIIVGVGKKKVIKKI